MMRVGDAEVNAGSPGISPLLPNTHYRFSREPVGNRQALDLFDQRSVVGVGFALVSFFAEAEVEQNGNLLRLNKGLLEGVVVSADFGAGAFSLHGLRAAARAGERIEDFARFLIDGGLPEDDLSVAARTEEDIRPHGIVDAPDLQLRILISQG